VTKVHTADNMRIALAVCRAYGIANEHLADAAVEVAAAMAEAPRPKRHAAAHRVARRVLARELGVPRRTLPRAPGRSQAVGQFEGARRKCRDLGEQFSFDRHSKHFAVANGVCPRCSAPGEFGEDYGFCPCGFGYGHIPADPVEGDEDALEELLGSARQSA